MQADADEEDGGMDESGKDSQAGHGTRTASGGTVEEQVARLHAAEEASSEEEEQSPDAAQRQVSHAFVPLKLILVGSSEVHVWVASG